MHFGYLGFHLWCDDVVREIEGLFFSEFVFEFELSAGCDDQRTNWFFLVDFAVLQFVHDEVKALDDSAESCARFIKILVVFSQRYGKL